MKRFRLNNIQYKQLEIVLLMVITTIALNLLVDCGILENGVHPVFHQVLTFGIGYTCLSKLLSFKNKYNPIMILGQVYFMGICIALYYSHTIADFIADLVCLHVVINVIIWAKEKRDKLN